MEALLPQCLEALRGGTKHGDLSGSHRTIHLIAAVPCRVPNFLEPQQHPVSSLICGKLVSSAEQNLRTLSTAVFVNPVLRAGRPGQQNYHRCRKPGSKQVKGSFRATSRVRDNHDGARLREDLRLYG